MANIHEVAKRAGVSLGTVSNVLNHPEVVAEATRARVLRVIEETGFIRNGSARNLRAGRSQSLGLIVLDVANPFFTEVARGVEDAANAAGYVVILCNSDDSLAKESNYLHVLEEQCAAGVLITPVHRNQDIEHYLRERGMPYVLLDRPSQSDTVCSVTVDHLRGGHLAGAHLVAQGHRRIGFVHGPLTIQQIADRQQGFYRAITEAGYDLHTTVVDVETIAQNVREGEKAIERLLDEQPLPTALFCGNDLLALGIMRKLREHGLKIPDDVALVGYDDVDFASALAPPLTSIRQPKYDLGNAAARLLIDEINGSSDHIHQHRVFLPELVRRQSS